MTCSWSQQGEPIDRDAFVLNLLGDLLRTAIVHGADRIIIGPLYRVFFSPFHSCTTDNVIFIIPEERRTYRVATTTEVGWRAIVARVKLDAGLNLNSWVNSQEGEAVYRVRGFFRGDDRVFVNIKTVLHNGLESVRLLLAH